MAALTHDLRSGIISLERKDEPPAWRRGSGLGDNGDCARRPNRPHKPKSTSLRLASYTRATQSKMNSRKKMDRENDVFADPTGDEAQAGDDTP